MNITESSSAWASIWDFITSFFTLIKEFLDSIIIFSIGGSFHASLWDFCLGIIIMGAIIGQFIIFSKPALPDNAGSNTIDKAVIWIKNGRYGIQ